MVHDIDSTALIPQDLDHMLLLIRVVGTNVPNEWNLGVLRGRSTRPTILNSDALAVLNAKDLASMVIDGRVRLGSGLGERSSGREDLIRLKVLLHSDFPDGRLHSAERRRRYDSQVVFPLVMQLLQFVHGTRAWLGLLLEHLDHLAQFLVDVVVELLVAEREVVFFAERGHHAAEVLADEVFEEGRAGVAVGETLLLEDLIGELGAGFESEGFGEHKGVVAVEEDRSDLEVKLAC